MLLKKKIIMLPLIVAFATLAFLFMRKKGPDHSAGIMGKTLDRYFTVKRDDLAIGLKFTGTVNARKKHKMSLEAAFPTKLVWIIDENSEVAKDALLAKFETEDLKTKIEDLEFDLDNCEKEIMIAEEKRKILLSSNKADIRNAIDKLTEAEEAYRKYFKFERHKQRDKLDLAIQNAEKKLDEAREDYKEKKDEILNSSYNEQSEEEKAKLELENLDKDINKAEIELKNAMQDRKVFKRYDHPNKITELQNRLAQAKLNMEKVKIETASKLIQENKSIKNLKLRLRRVKKDLIKFKSYLPMMDLRSPVKGVVIYGDPDKRWGNLEVKIGMDIRRKQVLLTIPDMSNLVVNFDLPEHYRSKVNIGDKVVIAPESIKTLTLAGKLSEIDSLPVNQIRWDRNSPKIYHSTVTLDNQAPELVSGMSVNIEIITKVLKSVLYLPVEAVFEKGGEYFVYLKTLTKPEKIKVEIGLSSDDFVEIKEGLSEGDSVYLYRPFKTSRGK